MVLPVSRARISAISPRRRRTISAALKNSRAFPTGGVSAQAGKASLAAAIAILASSAPQCGDAGVEVAGVGLEVVKQAEPAASRHCPSAYHW